MDDVICPVNEHHKVKVNGTLEAYCYDCDKGFRIGKPSDGIKMNIDSHKSFGVIPDEVVDGRANRNGNGSTIYDYGIKGRPKKYYRLK